MTTSCMSCHKVIVVITERALCVLWITYTYIIIILELSVVSKTVLHALSKVNRAV